MVNVSFQTAITHALKNTPVYELLVLLYRFLRGWRWYRHRYHAWRIGATLKIGYGSYILAPSVYINLTRNACLTIGNDVCLRRYTTIDVQERVEIGDNTLIAEMVTIRDHDHNIMPGTLYRKSGYKRSPIVIGQNVWLGNKVTVTQGVTIGDNSVVGANAVVTRDLPPNIIAVGIPARVLADVGLKNLNQ